MVKKLKAMADKQQSREAQLANAIRDSAQQIWLAGLGAFSKARADRAKVFEQLVKEGKNIQLRTKALAEERLGEVTGRVSEVKDRMNKMSRSATDSWDRLEQVFEERVSRALGRLGVPTSKDVQGLMKRVDELTASVQALGGKAPAAGKPAAKKAAAKNAAAKKAAAKKPAAKKAAAKKAAKAAPAAAKKAAAKAPAKARKAAPRKSAAPAPAPVVETPAAAPAAE
jgi:poly(hydroxyalkanoate) granule-associated protein